MIAINKRTGSPIIGTLERLQGRAEIDEIRPGTDGRPEVTFSGETEVFWESMDTAKDNAGRTVFLDRAGDEVPEYDVMFVAEERATEIMMRHRLTADAETLNTVIRLMERSPADGENGTETLAYLKELETRMSAEVAAITTREESKSPEEAEARRVAEIQSVRRATAIIARGSEPSDAGAAAIAYLKSREERMVAEAAAIREAKAAETG